MVEPHCVEGRDEGVPREFGGDFPNTNFARKFCAEHMAYGFETDLWTVNRLRRVIFDEFPIRLSKNTIWRRLRDAGLTYQKPEREYYEIDEATRKKWLRYEVPKIRRTVKKHRAILYFQDESNISLTAFLARTWGLRGQTPKAKVTGKASGRCCSFRDQPQRTVIVSTSRSAPSRKKGGDRVPRPNVASSPEASSSRCHGSSTAPYLKQDKSLDRQPAATTRVCLAQNTPPTGIPTRK